VIPPEANAEFVCQMEETLDVYHRPRDPARPLVCLDEASKQLVDHVTAPIEATPAHTTRIVDYEYVRNGAANIFMLSAPLEGRREALVTDRRTTIDYAHAIRHLVDVMYPDAEQIVLVQDNLNTHKPASLYAAFPPEEARRLLNKLEIHYTPKHGSWLNMAEIELGILGRQGLDRRIPSREKLEHEVAAWQHRRNASHAKVDWQFTTADARIKLKRLYPITENSNHMP